MKFQNVISLMALVGLLSLASSSAIADNPIPGRDGGGGSQDVIEFRSLALSGLNTLANMPALKDHPELVKKYEQAAKEVEISFVDKQMTIEIPSGGLTAIIDREAKNYPDRNLIEVNINYWRALDSHSERKRVLVIHEVCGIAGIDDSKNQITTQIYKANPDNYSGARLVSEPDSELEAYDKDLEVLKQLDNTSEQARRVAVYMLKKYYGFTDVQFAGLFHDQKRETILAVFFASNLREILPTWYDLKCFLKVNQNVLAATKTPPNLFFKGEQENNQYVIEFDSNEPAMNFTTDVKDIKPTPTNTFGRVEVYKLVVGSSRILQGTRQFKSMMSIMTNVGETFNYVNFDVYPLGE